MSRAVLLNLRVFLICAFAVGVIGLAVAVTLDRFKETSVDIAVIRDEPIVVSIDGAVVVPGVYDLPANARLNDLVAASGGFTADADTTGLNMAARIGDGETIFIPAKTVPTSVAVASPEPDALFININTATAAELEELPGIGEVLAGRIVAYREQFGPFSSVDQLVEVEGINENTVDELRPLVTTGG
jgi:competence protein ComEA